MGSAEGPGPIGGLMQEDEVPAESLRLRNQYSVSAEFSISRSEVTSMEV